jgi:hypothetical protein
MIANVDPSVMTDIVTTKLIVFKIFFQGIWILNLAIPDLSEEIHQMTN